MAKLSKFGKFAAIVGPISALTLALAIAVPLVAKNYEVTLDTTFGLGQLHINPVEGSENWDTEYNTKKYDSAEKSRTAANAVSKKISDEGIVLMRNKDNTLPLAKGANVSPFGYGYSTPTYGGSGSGNVDTSKDYIATPEKALKKHFSLVDGINNITKDKSKATIDVEEAPGTSKAHAGSGMFANDFSLIGIPTTAYDGVKASISNTNAVIFISRGGGEANDIKKDAYTDGTPHNLTLSQNEKDTIKYAKENGASKVIAIINSSNVMELDELVSGECEVDAIIWVGGPGAAGFESMADIMVGDVNPSGRTVDIYASDLLANPVVKNFGDFAYTNATYNQVSGTEDAAHFVEYEEGVYLGYRYYETAAAVVPGYNYESEVVYPFGHGLSYTNFKQEVKDFKVTGDEVKMVVTVTNEGAKAGKDVVQVYYTAPYTDFDKTNKIEKAAKNLVEFGKTGIIEAGKSEDVEITFSVEDMASYCYSRDNGDGTFGSYVLEQGEYTITLGKDSHNAWATEKYTAPKTVWYDNSNPRQSEKDGQSILDDNGNPTGVPEKSAIMDGAKFQAATNQFQESSDFFQEGKAKLLSRSDWANTQPTAPTDNDKTLAAKYLANLNDLKNGGFNVETNTLLGNVEGSKVYNNEELPVVASGLALNTLRGKSYYDKDWDTLLDQIDFSNETTISELCDLIFYGAYNTAEFNAIQKIKTNDFDGPQGISSFMTQGLDACAYCSEVVVASTFNVDLVREYGEAIGQEAMNNAGGIAGWYGPAMNTHRSPFSGRNFEYYSEDGLLGGKIAASVISGAADQGFYAYMKHFALNDMETNRMLHLCTWADEQTMREIYLKPFEICAKEARATLKYTADENGTKASKVVRGTTAVMSSFNSIGTTMASSNYSLLTEVLRNEWGFQGAVITDFGPHVDHDAMVRSGNDFLLNAAWGAKNPISSFSKDITSNTAKHVYRNAIKNISYTVVNSVAYNHVAPGATTYRDMAPWRVWLTVVAPIAFGALTVCGAGLIGWQFLASKKKEA